MNENGKRITSKDYLENALLEVPGVTEKAANKNRVRAAIKGFFQQRDCFPLVRPVEDEKQLQSLSSAGADVLRPKFVKQMEDLRTRVMTSADPKIIKSGLVSGYMLVELASSWVAAVNDGQVPSVEDTWTNVCQAECRKQVSNLQAKYLAQQKEILESLPVSEEELAAWNREEVEAARKAFKANTSTLQDALRASALDTLDELLAKDFADLKQRNEAKAQERLHQLLDEHFTPVEQAIDSDQYGGWGGQQGFKEAKDRARQAVITGYDRGKGATPRVVLERLEQLTNKAAQRMMQQLIDRHQVRRRPPREVTV